MQSPSLFPNRPHNIHSWMQWFKRRNNWHYHLVSCRHWEQFKIPLPAAVVFADDAKALALAQGVHIAVCIADRNTFLDLQTMQKSLGSFCRAIFIY